MSSKIPQSYQVSEIYRAVQGEGWWAGMPITLIRLQGCNLEPKCPFCDTKHTWDPKGGEEMYLADILQRVTSMHYLGDIVLITGGEPTMQPLKPLVNALGGLQGRAGYVKLLGPVHLETNGTNPIEGNFDWITISPKPPHKVDPQALERANEIKWLVKDPRDVIDLDVWLTEHEWERCVSVQPISQDPFATEVAYQACLNYGWRLSLQLQKYLKKP